MRERLLPLQFNLPCRFTALGCRLICEFWWPVTAHGEQLPTGVAVSLGGDSGLKSHAEVLLPFGQEDVWWVAGRFPLISPLRCCRWRVVLPLRSMPIHNPS